MTMKTDPKLGAKAAVNFAHRDEVPTLPHERDQAPDEVPAKPRKAMIQAFKDLQRGLVDTDLHGERGVEEVIKQTHLPTSKGSPDATTDVAHGAGRRLRKPPTPR